MHRGSATDFAQCTAVLLPEGRIKTKTEMVRQNEKRQEKKRKDSEKIKRGNKSQRVQDWI